MEEPPHDIFKVPAALSQIVVIQAVVSLKKIFTHLLNGPLGVDLFILDLVDDSVHKEPILKHEEVGIDEKRRLGPALALQLRLHALELSA